MHGSIICILENFIKDYYAYSYFDVFGLEEHNDKTVYPDEQFFGYFEKLAQHTRLNAVENMRRFGVYSGKYLMETHQAKGYFDPSWRTFDVLKFIESGFHTVVRRESNATPPYLHPFQITENWLIIDYTSPRKMAPYAQGIIMGVAEFFNETNIEVTSSTSWDSERVEIHVIKKQA